MISRESFDTIMDFADEAIQELRGSTGERQGLIRARGELDRAYWEAQKATVAAAEPDPEAEARRADERFVASAIEYHATEALLRSRAPEAGSVWPDLGAALTTWHLQRAQALQLLSVDEAARFLRGRR